MAGRAKTASVRTSNARGEKSKGEEAFALHCRAEKIPQPVRQHRFHPDRLWKFDFAWPEYKLAVEVEGGVWSNGRHTRGQGFIDDCEKYNAAAKLGWTVLRFPTEKVTSGEAIDDVSEFIWTKGPVEDR